MIERLNREIKRRTKVYTLFPNEASLFRLVSAILMEQSEEWESGKRYIELRDCSVWQVYRKKVALPENKLDSVVELVHTVLMKNMFRNTLLKLDTI